MNYTTGIILIIVLTLAGMWAAYTPQPSVRSLSAPRATSESVRYSWHFYETPAELSEWWYEWENETAEGQAIRRAFETELTGRAPARVERDEEKAYLQYCKTAANSSCSMDKKAIIEMNLILKGLLKKN